MRSAQSNSSATGCRHVGLDISADLPERRISAAGQPGRHGATTTHDIRSRHAAVADGYTWSQATLEIIY